MTPVATKSIYAAITEDRRAARKGHSAVPTVLGTSTVAVQRYLRAKLSRHKHH